MHLIITTHRAAILKAVKSDDFFVLFPAKRPRGHGERVRKLKDFGYIKPCVYDVAKCGYELTRKGQEALGYA